MRYTKNRLRIQASFCVDGLGSRKTLRIRKCNKMRFRAQAERKCMKHIGKRDCQPTARDKNDCTQYWQLSQTTAQDPALDRLRRGASPSDGQMASNAPIRHKTFRSPSASGRRIWTWPVKQSVLQSAKRTGNVPKRFKYPSRKP